MRVNRDTAVCISLAARPSNIGAAVHNAAYEALGLNFIYSPRTTTDLPAALAGVRALGIRGCSVSMPFKREVIPLLDAVSDEAAAVGAVNTIVNDAGSLRGYNTDVGSVAWALRRAALSPGDRVLVLGTGGMARACVAAARRVASACHISVAYRSAVTGLTGVTPVAWDARGAVDADVLINATPVGMAPEDGVSPMPVERLSAFRLVVDAVAMPPESLMCRQARGLGVAVVTGQELALRQAMDQFELYTGVPAPEAVMAAALAEVTASR